MEKQKTEALYTERFKHHNSLRRKYKRTYNINATARLLVFVVAIVGFYFALSTNVWIVTCILVATIIVFLVLVQYSARLERMVRWHKELALINEENLNALNGDFSEFDTGEEFKDMSHSFSYDLDVFGQESFFATINQTTRPGGKRMLAGWFMQPLQAWEAIRKRQQALTELGTKTEWRHQFMAHARINRMDDASENLFNRLSESEIGAPKWLIHDFIRWGVPVLTILTIVLSSLQFIPVGYPILFVLLQWGLVGLAMKYTKKADAALGRTEKIMLGQKALIKLIDIEPWESEALKQISQNLNEGKETALQSITRLAGIIKSFEYRNNFVVAIIANSLFLWDIQCVSRYSRWHTEVSLHIKDWMRALDTMDAMISGGAYWQNNPGFCKPLADAQQQLQAKELGHPLLSEDKRVVNDYDFPRGTFFHIITGANMAGKSTFLRTVTLNMVMAMAGLPVCAKTFRFTPVAIFTSMRTTDSLSKDESYFYAELRRLREAYDRIRKGERLFLVLDEILKGTNSEDKRKGSMDFLTQLKRYDVGGIVATHDTQLGALADQYPETFENYCFEIEITGEEVNFDYKLQPGVTQTMNAQLLMKQMGLIE